MIGLDTNVLVRFLVQDDPGQSERANTLVATLSPETPGFVSTTALVETYWVLTRAYKRDKDDVVGALGELVNNASIVTQDHDVAVRALGLTADGADFADAVIAESCRRAGCKSVASFDKRAVTALGFIVP